MATDSLSRSGLRGRAGWKEAVMTGGNYSLHITRPHSYKIREIPFSITNPAKRSLSCALLQSLRPSAYDGRVTVAVS